MRLAKQHIAAGTRQELAGTKPGHWRGAPPAGCPIVLLSSRCVLITALAVQLAACAAPRPQHDEDGSRQPAWNGEEIEVSDGQRLPLRRWGPDRPRIVVLALHGFNDHSGSMAALALHLAETGIAVYAYDQRGFGANPDAGRWAGHDRMAADAAHAAVILRERYPELPLYLAGKSMGGAVAVLALVDHASPVDGAVLIAPAVWGRQTMPWYQRSALWLGKLLPGLTFSNDFIRSFIDIRPTDDPEVMEQLRNDPLVLKHARADTLAGLTDLMDSALDSIGRITAPALVLYGGRDEIIPMPAACAMLERIEIDGDRRRMGYYPEGFHMLTRQLHSEPVLRDIAAWLHDPGSPLPSGHEIGHRQATATLCEGKPLRSTGSKR